MSNLSKQELRRQLIQQRLALSPQQIQQASQVICDKIIDHPLFFNSQRIAFYLAAKGEVDLQLLITRMQALGKKYFLPVLEPRKLNYLLFVLYEPGEALFVNRFGILEPAICVSKIAEPDTLDLVITPLVAFDKNLHRLGMGGGFYDRTFNFLRDDLKKGKPTLLGVGYEFQKVSQLKPNAWDISLDAVITEKAIYETMTQ